MSNPRIAAVSSAGMRCALAGTRKLSERLSDSFGCAVFTQEIMQRMLSKPIFRNLVDAMQGFEKIKPEYAEPIALAIKEWAISCGASHYTHWFQPLTEMTAEKHDSFLEWGAHEQLIESFSGKQLLQGEPDASSFPSGGLRSTYEARGYTCWDPTSPIFLWSGGDGVTLCIPSLFFSWTGEILDCKIPLLRAVRKLSDASLRLLNLLGVKAKYVQTTVGLEQEYFVIDRALKNLRPDLALLGRTVFGAAPPKGQELQDHYFGAVKDRILAYMRDFEMAAISLGIPVKTRHNEVAPAQHEVAPLYELASKGIDHNLLLMELMRQLAVKHDLSCLLNEKPFARINGSGKHCNWSLSTDTGLNLLNPNEISENNIHFLVLLTAILSGVHRHAALLRAAIGSLSNDCRLGGHEAPPAIISIYLGETLENFLDDIETKGYHTSSKTYGPFDLGLHQVPPLPQDNTDRNRTSPFAFTGNKFEFRAVGSSSNPSFAVTCLNVAVAESLNEIIDEIEKKLCSEPDCEVAILSVIRPRLEKSRAIRFSGNNYSEQWAEEAKKRQLPNIKKSVNAFEYFTAATTVKAFEGILTENELRSRYDIAMESYGNLAKIEVKLMLELFYTQILPAAWEHKKNMVESVTKTQQLLDEKALQLQQINYIAKFNAQIEKALEAADLLDKSHKAAREEKNFHSSAKKYAEEVLEKAAILRVIVDNLENNIEDRLWQLPKYRELLFTV